MPVPTLYHSGELISLFPANIDALLEKTTDAITTRRLYKEAHGLIELA